MSQKVTASALVIALSLAFASESSAHTRRSQPKGKLAVPLTGSVVSVGGGSFAGSLILLRFAVRHGDPVAIGAISGTLRTPAGSRTVLHALVELPVTIEQTAGFQPQRGSSSFDRPTIRFVQATCEIVNVAIGGTDLDLLGLTLHLDPVVLALNGDSAGALGNLVCQVLALVNNVVGLVGILNLILGLLGGILGGLGGLGGALPV